MRAKNPLHFRYFISAKSLKDIENSVEQKGAVLVEYWTYGFLGHGCICIFTYIYYFYSKEFTLKYLYHNYGLLASVYVF